VIVNGEGQLIYESPSAERTLGYRLDDQMGQDTIEFVHEDDLPRIQSIFDGIAGNPGEVVRDELRVWHKDGSLRIIEVVGQNLLDNPAVGGVVASIRDVTERRQAEEDLQQMYRQEKELRQQVEDEMKRRVEFTRALAHELKTPLTSVLASSDLLASELRDEPMQTLARNIQQGASNLDGRIDELLDLAKGEVGMLQLKLETIDLVELLTETAEAMSPLASRRGQSLTLSLAAALPPVRADATRLQQVVNNLLVNAFKFTAVGGSVKLTARRKNGDVVVEVKDSGRGIAKEEQKWLFEPYRRPQKEPSGGLGLGLALSKTLVELHGGQIWVKSNVGRGSTFGFSLPLEAGEARTVGQEKPARLWKVLIIEDDPEIVSFVKVAFEIRWPEAELISTSLGEEGLDLVEAESPDLVILDVGLPDMDGFDVLRGIRLFSSVPVVVLTVKSDEADMVRGLEWGADDYVVKPFRQLELLARLKVQLRRRDPADEEAPVVCGALRLDPTTFQLTYGGRDIGLTLVEGRIMQHLMQNAGHVVTHSRLAEAVWGEDHPGALDSLRVYIRHLREKIEEDSSSPKLILTKVGVGYMLSRQV
jgi:two-component system KDP operon response regulator KdpE